MAKWPKSQSCLRDIAVRKGSEGRERLSGDKGEMEEVNGKNMVEQKEEAKLRGEPSLVEILKGRQKGERREMEEGKKESKSYQMEEGRQTVGEMEEGAPRLILGLQKMRKPSGRKTQGKQKKINKQKENAMQSTTISARKVLIQYKN